MFNKFNVWDIFPQHLKTFHDRSGERDYASLLFYILVPTALPLLSFFYNYYITVEFAGIAISGFAIFGGLLFAIPVSLYEMFDKAHNQLCEAKNANSKVYPYQRDFLENLVLLIKETYYNVTFCILLCFVAIIFTFFAVWSKDCPLTLMIFSFLGYYVYGIFMLTILMVVKRVYRIFEKRFELKN